MNLLISLHPYCSALVSVSLCYFLAGSCFLWQAQQDSEKVTFTAPTPNPQTPPPMPDLAVLLCSLEGLFTSQTPATIHRRTTENLSFNLHTSVNTLPARLSYTLAHTHTLPQLMQIFLLVRLNLLVCVMGVTACILRTHYLLYRQMANQGRRAGFVLGL